MIVVIGEILIDIFRDYQRIGGAPFNFAFHLKKLGFPVRFLTRVGDDRFGRRIVDRLQASGFDTADIQKPVVQRLLRLMAFRNTCAAFEGQFSIDDTPDDRLQLTWCRGAHHTTLRIDLRNYDTRIDYFDEERQKMVGFTA